MLVFHHLVQVNYFRFFVMAASNSTDSRAPEQFHIPTTNENDDSHHWSDCFMKCPLCVYSKKSFHCRNCIRNGSFRHTSDPISEM